MSNDLISRKAIIIKVSEANPMGGMIGGKFIEDLIRSEPTAYDVDGVVEQLESKIESCKKQIINPPHDSLDQAANDVSIDFMNAYQDAIKTVRSGGVQNER